MMGIISLIWTNILVKQKVTLLHFPQFSLVKLSSLDYSMLSLAVFMHVGL